MLASALEHCELLDSLGFTRYCVSLKDSDPAKVVEVNRRFAAQRPDVPLHLGVTEAGMPPDGILKTRIAFEQLISRGIGDTIRVSLTVPNARKPEEIDAGRQILADIAAGRLLSAADCRPPSLNIISCPSCSRVENEAFVELAQQVRQMTRYASDVPLTIAVMGCRVNGPGETDDADLGLWCGPNFVNLKRRGDAARRLPLRPDPLPAQGRTRSPRRRPPIVERIRKLPQRPYAAGGFQGGRRFWDRLLKPIPKRSDATGFSGRVTFVWQLRDRFWHARPCSPPLGWNRRTNRAWGCSSDHLPNLLAFPPAVAENRQAACPIDGWPAENS